MAEVSTPARPLQHVESMAQREPPAINSLQPPFSSWKDLRMVTTGNAKSGLSAPLSSWNKLNSGLGLGNHRAPIPTCRIGNIPSFRTSTEDGSQCVAIEQAPKECSPSRKILRREVDAGKWKTGRPLAYTGDPNSPALTEADQRKLKRRISNRESARRIRNKRVEQIETLTAKIEEQREDQAALETRADDAEQENARIIHCVEDWRGKATAADFENQQLQQEARNLRRAYEEPPALISTLQPPFSSSEDTRMVTTGKAEGGLSEPRISWSKQNSGHGLGNNRAPTPTSRIGSAPNFRTPIEDGRQCVVIGQAAGTYSLPREMLRHKVTAGRRKIGRPLAYTGDPDSPALSEADKRMIKRRISNRESARRIKNRHMERIETLTAEIEELREDQEALKARAEEAEQENARLTHQVEDWRGKAAAADFENQQLQQEARHLRRAYEANLSVLENALSKQDSAVEQIKLQEQKQPVETPFAAVENRLKGLFDEQVGLENLLLDPDFDPRPAIQRHADKYGSLNQCKLPSLTESAEFALAAFTQALAR